MPRVSRLLRALALVVPAGTGLAQQTGTITGRVLGPGGRPAVTATVRIVDLGLGESVDSAGTFRFARVPVGSHIVRVEALGFEPNTHGADVRAGAITRVTIHLRSIATLSAVVVQGAAPPGSVQPAPDVLGTLVLAGAKAEMLQVGQMDANLSEKVPRQIFAKIPGVFVYDMDGAGNQINVSTRGLDAHRSWEMNVRQDGVLVNSDVYGYPAAHYSPPMEAMERLELVRGTAALQYGSQFGGLINYVTKVDTASTVAFESISSAGSFGLLSTFNSLSGRVGALTYSAYMGMRESNGYRQNSSSEATSQFLSARYAATPTVALRAQLGRSYYRYRIPGPLTDSMFFSDPRHATRARNWFSPDIYVPSLLAEWSPSDRTTVTAQASAVLGDRSSVQFIGFANIADTLSPRQVDIDNFNSRTVELRITRSFDIAGREATLAAGLTLSDNDLRRRQQGRGTTAADYDLALTAGGFGRDVNYRTKNISVFAEQLLRVTDAWSIIPGARVENGITRMSGALSYYDPADVPTEIEHRFPLFGLRTEYKLPVGELYGGWSQSYRPMILKDVLPESAIERTDPGLRDATGWTAEAGARGTLAGRLAYDVSAFLLRYDNRFGVLLLTDSTSTSYLFKTNVGSSDTKGLEVSLEAPVLNAGGIELRAYTATSWFHARYRSGSVVVSGVNTNLAGRRVESVPTWISRSGITGRAGRATASLLLSYTSESYADPQNTEAPTVNGARGLVPAYSVVDANASVQLAHWIRLRAGIGNVFDRSYFTKRPAFYPGPGVWPSDGRNVQVSVELRRQRL